MSLEQQIAQMPKMALALLAMVATVIFLFVFNPPHTICDTQLDTLKENLVGPLFPTVIKKNTIQPHIKATLETCKAGHSAGACFEYFSILKMIAKQIDNASPECRAQLIDVKEVQTALKEGVEIMALAAWGSQPPASPAMRFGWMQESELAVFCYIKDVYEKALGEEVWSNLRLQVNKKFPGESPSSSSLDVEGPKAIEKMSDNEIWTKSIFSVRCDGVI